MFNALRPDELLVGVGRVLRLVAAAPGELQEYERSQALSAYSVTRLLAAEQGAARGLMHWTKAAMGEAALDDDRLEVRTAARAVEQAEDGAALGEALSSLLGVLTEEDPLRERVHRILAELVDREVGALAEAPK